MTPIFPPASAALRMVCATLVLMGATGLVQACRVPPRQVDAAAQIAEARDVSLARVVRATPLYADNDRPLSGSAVPFSVSWSDPLSRLQGRPLVVDASPRVKAHAVVYEFEVQERYRGEDRPAFIVDGIPHVEGNDDTGPKTDYNQEAFWEAGGGRLSVWDSCSAQASFVVGELYLVFLGTRAHARSFEHVVTLDGQPNPGDKWLAYVRAAMPAGAPSATRDQQ